MISLLLLLIIITTQLVRQHSSVDKNIEITVAGSHVTSFKRSSVEMRLCSAIESVSRRQVVSQICRQPAVEKRSDRYSSNNALYGNTNSCIDTWCQPDSEATLTATATIHTKDQTLS